MLRAQAGSIAVLEVVEVLVCQLFVLQDQKRKCLFEIKDELITVLLELLDNGSSQNDDH